MDRELDFSAPLHVKRFNSCSLPPLSFSHFPHLSLSFVLPCLLCIILLITNLLFNSWPCPIFPSVRCAVAFHSLLDVSLLPIFSFSLSHFHFFFWPFHSLLQVGFPLIKTRRGLHFCVQLTKPSSLRWITCSPFLSVCTPSTSIPDSRGCRL